jgi:5'(3')-deoxyribonucleotidase
VHVEWNDVKHVYVDLDGVLVDFIGGVNMLLDRADTYPMQDVGLHVHYGMPADSFWEQIDRAGHGFWASLSPYFWTESLVSNLVRRFGPDNVTIATSPAWHGSSAHGKISWMHEHLAEHFGVRMFRGFAITPQKHLLASPSTLLIDDSKRMVESFRDHGGQAVLFPQPWNAGAEAAARRGEVLANLCR